MNLLLGYEGFIFNCNDQHHFIGPLQGGHLVVFLFFFVGALTTVGITAGLIRLNLLDHPVGITVA